MGIDGLDDFKPEAQEVIPPSLNGEPVVLIHLESPEGSGLAACCGKIFKAPTDQYRNYPHILCPGCSRDPEKKKHVGL
jgi:hypothetical protein